MGGERINYGIKSNNLNMKYPISPFLDTEEHSILVGYRGIIAHGMYIPKEREGIDDKYVIVIFIPPKRCYLGLGNIEVI